MRSTNAVASRNRRKKVLKQTKGMQKARRRSYRLGKQAVNRSLQYSYRDRRTKKRDFRKLWITRINAAVREHGMTYSSFINKLTKAEVKVDRKMLAELAVNEPAAFAAVVKAVK